MLRAEDCAAKEDAAALSGNDSGVVLQIAAKQSEVLETAQDRPVGQSSPRLSTTQP